MPSRLVTVSELVEICAPPSDAHRALWLRRARDWSAAGVLPPTRRHHEGTGRHRLYDFDLVYLATVLFRMSDLGVPVGVLAQISRLIRAPRRTKAEIEFKKFWKDAIQEKGATSSEAYLAVAPVPNKESESAYYRTGRGSISFNNDGAWAVINISIIFRKLATNE